MQNFHFKSHNLKSDEICSHIIRSSQQYNKKFEVLTTYVRNNYVFWDITVCLCVDRSDFKVRRIIKQIVVIIEAYHFCQPHSKFYPTSCCKGLLHMQRKFLGWSMLISTQQVTTIHIFCIAKYLRKKAIKWSSVSAIYSLQGSLWFR